MQTGVPRILGVAVAAAGVALSCACSTAPINERDAIRDALDEARASLQKAELAGAPELASLEMTAARDKLSQAEAVNRHHDAGSSAAATALAEQADVDAQVAEASAQLIRSRKAAMDFDGEKQTGAAAAR